jgi:alpha-L-fucosidase
VARGGWTERQRAALARPVPTPSQLAWQRDELAIFFHVGVNTFTNREWGDGTESPSIFAPAALDVRQWTRAAKAGGFKAAILTAKHHDGFCLWPTRTTKHSVAASPFRGGDGDLVREFVDACRADDLRPGVYLSPWDRNSPVYGDSPRYSDLYIEQLTELLTNYGRMAEVWFDGANGEGPNGRKQEYDWPRVWGTVRRLQPDAVMFSDAGPDVRWGGNENGIAGDPCWSTVDPAVVPVPGMSGAHIIAALQHGDPNGTVWRPAEADTSIRPGWFYHPEEDARVKSVDQLVDVYLRSVGRNSKLLLNVPPMPSGLLHETDVARLAALRARLDAMFGRDLAEGRVITWQDRSPGSNAVVVADLGEPVSVRATRLAEDITRGQAVSAYRIMRDAGGGNWQPLAEGTTVGFARIDVFEAVTARRLSVRVDVGPVTNGPLSLTLQVF